MRYKTNLTTDSYPPRVPQESPRGRQVCSLGNLHPGGRGCEDVLMQRRGVGGFRLVEGVAPGDPLASSDPPLLCLLIFIFLLPDPDHPGSGSCS